MTMGKRYPIQKIRPQHGARYSDVFWSNLYATLTAYGRTETTLNWQRYAAFLVTNGLIINALGLERWPEVNPQPFVALILGLFGLGLASVWHVLNFSGWLNQNLFYWMASRLTFTDPRFRKGKTFLALPTEWWRQQNDAPPRPCGYIYHLAQVVPCGFGVGYALIVGLGAHAVGLSCGLAMLLSFTLLIVTGIITGVLESKEYRRRQLDEASRPMA